MTHKEHIEWRDIWVTGADGDKLPKLLLVGDSIARSYYSTVESELNGSYHCARLATSTCVSDKCFEKDLGLLLDDYVFSVIHFNNGLHGWDYDEPSYAAGLDRVLGYISGRCPQSRLIWATTTPVHIPGSSAFDPKTDRVIERNRLVREIAVRRKLPINDLYACVIDHPEYFSQDGVHYNEEGQKMLGKQVARLINV